MARIFISHSYLDEAIAYKLVNFLLAALRMEEEEIFCSSNPDQGLSYSSSSVPDQLKKELKNSEALIVLITADSLHSAWIPFEAGAFWPTDKPMIPILGPGLTLDDLQGPLKSLLSISIDTENWKYKVNNAINQLVKRLKIEQKVSKRRDDTLREFSEALKAWKSQRSAPNPALQKEIEELTQKLKESSELIEQLESKERSQKKQLEEVQELSQQEKEKLEAASQQEKSELKQSLTSQIRQLEQQLDEARSQNENDQNEIMRLREVIERSRKQQLENKKPKPSQAQSFIEKLGNDVKLEMIAIPGGKFLMGTEDEEIERLVKKYDREWFRNEKPQHKVTVQPFYMGKYPITQAQYQQIMGNNPSHFKGDDQRPVENVSWEDAVEFCQRLSQQTVTEYRLPSEAEWEYACRAGTNTKYYFGDEITSDLANYGGNVGETTAVGKYPPNAFGLSDMHGNVWEWCQDKWHDSYDGAPTDGSAWVSETSSKYVIRSGSWANYPNDCRSAYRNLNTRDNRYDGIGVRVVCIAPLQ